MNIKDAGNNCKVIYLIKKIDAESSREVDTTLQEVSKSNPQKVVCNMKETEYISSAGLRVFLTHAKNLKKINSELCFCCLTAYVNEIFETSGFSNIMKIFPSEADALK